MTFAPSKFQSAIFANLATSAGNLIVEAVAGSGKTTTLVKGIDAIDPRKKILMLAFNKAIQVELDKKTPGSVTVKTCHATGLNALVSLLGYRPKVDNQKVYKTLRYMRDEEETITQDEYKLYSGAIKKLVSLAKSELVLIENEPTDEFFTSLIQKHDVCSDNMDVCELIELTRSVLIKTANHESVIDFDDMIFLPLLYKAQFPKFDFVFVDESQDLNLIQRLMVERLMHASTRVVFVGDSRQAIYGFRGADSNSMENLKNRFNCEVLPLSISYRCSLAVVNEAQKIVGDSILPSDNAIQGSVKRVRAFSDYKRGDSILCRNNAPLISKAYELINNGVSINFTKRDLGEGLVTLVKKIVKDESLNSFLDEFEAYLTKETEKLARTNQENKIEAFHDKLECLMHVYMNLEDHSMKGLIASIKSLFVPAKYATVTLSSIHGSKGLEWDRVFILRPDLLPSPYAKQAWQLEQESNLHYVAVTRAKRDLVYLES